MTWCQVWREADVNRQTSDPPHLTVWRQTRQLRLSWVSSVSVSRQTRTLFWKSILNSKVVTTQKLDDRTESVSLVFVLTIREQCCWCWLSWGSQRTSSNRLSRPCSIHSHMDTGQWVISTSPSLCLNPRKTNIYTTYMTDDLVVLLKSLVQRDLTSLEWCQNPELKRQLVSLKKTKRDRKK